jgi:hypothetical protein
VGERKNNREVAKVVRKGEGEEGEGRNDTYHHN